MNSRSTRSHVVSGLVALAFALALAPTAEAQSRGRPRPKPAKSRQVYVFPHNRGKIAAEASKNQSRHKQDAAKRVLRKTEKLRPTKPASLKERLSQYKSYKRKLGLTATQPLSRTKQKVFVRQNRHGTTTRGLYPQLSSFKRSPTLLARGSSRLRALSSRLSSVLPKRFPAKTIAGQPKSAPKSVRESLKKKLSAKRTKIVFGNGPGVAVGRTEYRFLGLSKWRKPKPRSRSTKPRFDLWKAWSDLWRQ